jgi:uncharacterized protein (DUF1501 family)
MSKLISRRKFVGYSGLSLLNMALAPRLVLGQSLSTKGGTGKNLVFVNLYGGLDGLFAFPYLSGAISDRLSSSLRPTLSITPSSILEAVGQGGKANKVGLHPAFSPLFNIAASRCAVIEGYGIPGDPGRSHDTCQVLMSLGTPSRPAGGDMVGFLARLMDLLNWESFQYWALLTENPSDTNTRKRAPMIVSNVDEFSLPPLGWERGVDRDFAEEIARELRSRAATGNEREVLFSESVSRVRESVAQVQTQIANQSVGKNQRGDYSESQLGRSLKDAAKIIKSKGISGSIGLSGKDLLILAGQSGFDTHADQANLSNDDNLPSLLTDMANNFAVFYQDLETMAALNDTVIVAYSEFGRTVRQNSRAGESRAGSDHGHGSNTLVFGGPIVGGVYGAPPTINELLDEDYNALLPKVDFRDIFSEIFRWLGVEPTQVFNDPSYSPQRLGFLSI